MHIPAIGDWVHSCSPGVWRVYRVLAGFYEPRYSLDDPKQISNRVIVFSKRLVNAQGERDFGTDSCSASLVKPLAADDRRRVEELLAADPGLGAAFEAYEPRPIPSIINLAMNVPDRSSVEELARTRLAAELTDGIPLDRVIELLNEAGLGKRIRKTPFNATLQLVCRDHEVKEGEFILRDCKVLPF